MLFMKRLEVVDSFNANTEKWFTLFEVVKQRVAYQTKIANQVILHCHEVLYIFRLRYLTKQSAEQLEKYFHMPSFAPS